MQVSVNESIASLSHTDEAVLIPHRSLPWIALGIRGHYQVKDRWITKSASWKDKSELVPEKVNPQDGPSNVCINFCDKEVVTLTTNFVQL